MHVSAGDSERPILVVEDDPAAIRLIEEAFAELDRTHDYVVATDGVEVFDCLCGRGDYEKPHLPSLVLLDLDLPEKSGQQVLEELQSDERLALIPVVVLSSTDDQEAIAACYEQGANAYVVKPGDYERLLEKLAATVEFWMETTASPLEA